MSSRSFAALAVLLLGGSLLAVMPEAPRPAGEAGGKARLKVGMTPDEVTKHVGPPARVSRQVYQLRYQEQWHYHRPEPMRLTFDCQRGQKPQLERIR